MGALIGIRTVPGRRHFGGRGRRDVGRRRLLGHDARFGPRFGRLARAQLARHFLCRRWRNALARGRGVAQIGRRLIGRRLARCKAVRVKYYACDLNDAQTVVSNCAATDTGTYAISTSMALA